MSGWWFLGGATGAFWVIGLMYLDMWRNERRMKKND